MGNEKSVIIAALVILVIGGIFYAADPGQRITGKAFFDFLRTEDEYAPPVVDYNYRTSQDGNAAKEILDQGYDADSESETLSYGDVVLLEESRAFLNTLFEEGRLREGAPVDDITYSNLNGFIYGSGEGNILAGDKPPELRYKRCGRKEVDKNDGAQICTQTELCTLGDNLECNKDDCLCKCPSGMTEYQKNGKKASKNGERVDLCCPAEVVSTDSSPGPCGATLSNCKATNEKKDSEANSEKAGLNDGQPHCYQKTTCEAKQETDGTCTLATTTSYSPAKK